MAEAKSDFERGLFKGVSIYFHDVMGACHYAVSLESVLSADGAGSLVDARTGAVREFKTMDAAHAAVRQIGFHAVRFSGSVK
jgi:hypothetical protein